MARSKANWRRLKEIGSHFTQYKEYWVHLQRWEAPWESAGAMAGMAALAYYPHLVLAGCLVSQLVDAAPQGRKASFKAAVATAALNFVD